MTSRRIILFLFFISAACSCFAQASLLRDYVGLINQTFHPDIVKYMEKFKENMEKRGNTGAAKSIDAYLKGGSGTGFVYIDKDGKNYIITNHHVITQSYTLSVTFEKPDGAKTKYEGLTILAADEDMDIALLGFPEGQKPFGESLEFLDRPVEEGEDVYSAGFPGLGMTTLWQFGRGMVSNAHAAFPPEDDTGTMMGPYIQHTAQVDPGNSGGPLLVPVNGALTGYAVTGINTLSARYRQAANFSIPMDRVRLFLDAALAPGRSPDFAGLEKRVNAFISGLSADKAAYKHIAKFLSNECTAVNAEYALNDVVGSAPRQAANDIIEAFNYSPVTGMNYAVAWTIENALRTRDGKIDISPGAVDSAPDSKYTVSFNAGKESISSVWINEYGIWRIESFGKFAAGDREFAEKQAQEKMGSKKLHAGNVFVISLGPAYIPDREPAGALEIGWQFSNIGSGIRAYIGPSYFQLEGTMGVYIPFKLKKIAFTPFGNIGLGFAYKIFHKDGEEFITYFDRSYDKDTRLLDAGLSFQTGLQFTTAYVPGLYVQAAYQFNAYLSGLNDSYRPDHHIFSCSLGYAF
jgi:serine protease Do